jgi:hypothetical protein
MEGKGETRLRNEQASENKVQRSAEIPHPAEKKRPKTRKQKYLFSLFSKNVVSLI